MPTSLPDSLSLADDPTVTPNAKAVHLAAVKWHALHNSPCTYASLSAFSGLEGSTLQRAVRELEARNVVFRFRAGNGMAVRLGSQDQSNPVVVASEVELKPEQQQQEQAPASARSSVPTDNPLLSELLGLGVAARQAVKLVAKFAASRIAEVLQAVKAKLDKLSNPAGWIVTALQEAWSFVSRPPAASPSVRPHAAHEPHHGPHRASSNRTDPRPEEKAIIERDRAIEAAVDRLERGLSEGEREALEAEVEIPADIQAGISEGWTSLRAAVRTGVRGKLKERLLAEADA